jgi:CheY-like chemotaxis protein/DNA-binding MarR family transcriptional regulator
MMMQGATTAEDVLLIDDDEATIDAYARSLRRAGLGCHTAPDGWRALDMLSGGLRPRVIVSDLRMPELGGIQFAQQLRKMGNNRARLIFVSGNVGVDDAVDALRLGACEMLSKPIDAESLVRAVKTALYSRADEGTPEAKAPPVAAPVAAAVPAPPNPVSARRIALTKLRGVRRLRARFLPAHLFADPSWDMLLDLYDAELADMQISVTMLATASSLPLTTALRRLEVMEGQGLVKRFEDPADRRKTLVRLTAQSLEALEKFFSHYVAQV